MLAELIQQVAGGERKDHKYAIRPSAVSPEIAELNYKGRCKRQMVFNALGFSADNTNDRMILVMDDSSWHELLTGDWINKTVWKLRDSQMVINCGYFGQGHIDGILTDILGNDYLFEHKAINHFSYQRYLEGKELPIDYSAQCCVYLNQELKDYDIDEALLLIKNKNTAQYLEFLIEYDKQQDTARIVYKMNSTDQKRKELNIEIKDILLRSRKKFEFVEKCKEEKRLPLREYEYSDWQCLDKNTMIYLANGKIKEISKLKMGEKIKAIDGVTTIKKATFRYIKKQWLKIKAIGLLGIECTDDHLLLTAIWDNLYKWQKKEPFIPQYIQAGELMNYKDKFVSVIVPIHKSYYGGKALTKLECEFLGYYAAEGCLGNWQKKRYYRVHFVLGEKENELAERIGQIATKLFDTSYTKHLVIDKRTGWKSLRVDISSIKAVNFIRSHIIGTATTKELSASIMGASCQNLKIFIDAAIKGDGYFNKKQEATILSTSSKKLCLQYQQICWRLRIPAIAQYSNKPIFKFFGKQSYQTNQAYRIQFQGEISTLKFIKIANSTFVIARIKSVEKIEHDDECWDIEVDSPYHNFATCSGFVHNCSYCSYKNKCWEAYEKEFVNLSTDLELSNDMEERLAYYLELDMHLKEMEKEQKGIKEQIKQIMREKEARQAITQKYAVILSLFKSKRIDKDKIPDDILKQAQIEMLSERLTIKLKPHKS